MTAAMGGAPRRTPDDVNAEALVRLCDAIERFCDDAGDLPEPSHARYRVRLLAALGALRRRARDAKAVLAPPMEHAR